MRYLIESFGYFRNVDLFITMTTNPQWEEIVAELLHGQTAYYRPDLVTRETMENGGLPSRRHL